jgi:hypothetical protein
MHQARDERKEIHLGHPFAEGPATDDAGKAATAERPCQTKRRISALCFEPSDGSQDDS